MIETAFCDAFDVKPLALFNRETIAKHVDAKAVAGLSTAVRPGFSMKLDTYPV